jgi:threonine dehydrogenase-like Zn-dependent dehydrogenase
MRALTVIPGQANSARLDDIASPPLKDGSILVRTLAIGICGTDREIINGDYGWSPPGESRLVLGHESLGMIEDAPANTDFKKGDLVAGIVRRPDPLPCPACAVGEWDMCRNGQYTERGIKERHGYGSDFFRIEPEFLIKVDKELGTAGVLLEPTSVVAKAWDHIARIGARTRSWTPTRVLITGAGPVGLLAAMIGAERGYEMHVLDRAETGAKPDLVRRLGATYHQADTAAMKDIQPDIVIECTGASQVVLDALENVASGGIVCLAGVSSGGRKIEIDLGLINRSMVLENEVVFGTVNANRSHYEAAALALAHADKAWLASLISRRVAPEDWHDALTRRPDDIKVVLDFTLGKTDASSH